MEESSKNKSLTEVTKIISEERVMNFSDGVFAFAATLLVLKIDLPALDPSQVSSPNMTAQLLALWPQYFANIISFLMIGYYWLAHHAIFSLIKKMNHQIIWLNIIFLILLSFLPFPVDLFGDYSNSSIVIIFYSLTLSLVGVALFIMWAYALHAKLINQSLTKKHVYFYSCKFLLAPVVFALSIPLVFIDPLLSKISWAFVIVGIFLIDKVFNYKRIDLLDKNSIE